MIDKLKEHLAAGDNVRILTARVSKDPYGKVARTIQALLQTNVGQAVPVTDVKDEHMTKLYDDRAVQVEPNTGRIIGEGEQSLAAPKPAETAPVKTSDPEGLPPLIENRSGVWTFAGRVPRALVYVQEDGSPITKKQGDDIASFGPGVVKGIKGVSFPTREAAVEAGRPSSRGL